MFSLILNGLKDKLSLKSATNRFGVSTVIVITFPNRPLWEFHTNIHICLSYSEVYVSMYISSHYESVSMETIFKNQVL